MMSLQNACCTKWWSNDKWVREGKIVLKEAAQRSDRSQSWLALRVKAVTLRALLARALPVPEEAESAGILLGFARPCT